MNSVRDFPFLFILFVMKASALFEGDDCVMVDFNLDAGKCTNIHQCDHAKKLLLTQKMPQNCGFDRNTPLVCCPVSNTTKLEEEGTISEQKCKEYHHVNNGGTYVAGGEKAKLKEFPHMAALGYDVSGNLEWMCGGSLISEMFVLTAAHCTNSRSFGKPKSVRLGDLDLDRTNEAQHQDIAVDRVYVHPEYKFSSFYNDIALLKLQERVRFGHIKPACLDTGKNSSIDVLQVVGWGQTEYLGSGSRNLMKASLNVIRHKKCFRVYGNESTRLSQGIMKQYQICAGDASGKDTCPGDSGGPLHYRKSATSDIKEHFVVVGITSFGKGCGEENAVGVYTRVSEYITWIENIVWPLE